MRTRGRITAAVTAAIVGLAVAAGTTAPAHAESPPANASAAITGPEGIPLTKGIYWSRVWLNGVWTPLSDTYVWLDRGNTWTFGYVHLTLELNGELVMYSNLYQGRVYWRSNTKNSGATQLVLQRDGNLVLYTANYARPVWWTGTQNRCDRANGYQPSLSAQGDSNLVVYCTKLTYYQGPDTYAFDMKYLWATGTSGAS